MTKVTFAPPVDVCVVGVFTENGKARAGSVTAPRHVDSDTVPVTIEAEPGECIVRNHFAVAWRDLEDLDPETGAAPQQEWEKVNEALQETAQERDALQLRRDDLAAQLAKVTAERESAKADGNFQRQMGDKWHASAVRAHGEALRERDAVAEELEAAVGFQRQYMAERDEALDEVAFQKRRIGRLKAKIRDYQRHADEHAAQGDSMLARMRHNEEFRDAAAMAVGVATGEVMAKLAEAAFLAGVEAMYTDFPPEREKENCETLRLIADDGSDALSYRYSAREWYAGWRAEQ